MQKIGVGTDIAYIPRFKDISQNAVKKILTVEETKYCFSKSKPEQHIAARFAAKESVIKAFSKFNKNRYSSI